MLLDPYLSKNDIFIAVKIIAARFVIKESPSS